jgi:hypothetical protein
MWVTQQATSKWSRSHQNESWVVDSIESWAADWGPLKTTGMHQRIWGEVLGSWGGKALLAEQDLRTRGLGSADAASDKLVANYSIEYRWTQIELSSGPNGWSVSEGKQLTYLGNQNAQRRSVPQHQRYHFSFQLAKLKDSGHSPWDLLCYPI